VGVVVALPQLCDAINNVGNTSISVSDGVTDIVDASV
jgi:hypothetical protein